MKGTFECVILSASTLIRTHLHIQDPVMDYRDRTQRCNNIYVLQSYLCCVCVRAEGG